jgi:hypothetical protein
LNKEASVSSVYDQFHKELDSPPEHAGGPLFKKMIFRVKDFLHTMEIMDLQPPWFVNWGSVGFWLSWRTYGDFDLRTVVFTTSLYEDESVLIRTGHTNYSDLTPTDDVIRIVTELLRTKPLCEINKNID